MPDQPYKSKEVETLGNQLPERGPLCPMCGVRIPQFAELSASEERRIRSKTPDSPTIAKAEIQFLTGCSELWARIWVEHQGYSDSSHPPVCNSPKRTRNKAYDIEKILSGDDPNVAVCDLCVSLEMTKDRLNDAEIAVLTARNCCGEIRWDGIDLWLCNNPDISWIKEARAAFRAIGARQHADIMERLQAIFAASETSDDPDAFMRIHGLPATRNQMNTLDSEFYQADEEEDVVLLLHQYIRRHPKHFR